MSSVPKKNVENQVFMVKKKGRVAIPGPSCAYVPLDRHQAVTGGPLSAVRGENRDKWRSPLAKPSERTSWPRTLPASASRKDGVQPSWVPVSVEIVWVSIVSVLREAWPATLPGRALSESASFSRKTGC